LISLKLNQDFTWLNELICDIVKLSGLYLFVSGVTFDIEQKVTKTFDHGQGRDPMTQV